MSFHEWFVYQKIGLEIESAKILKFNTALEVFRVCLTVNLELHFRCAELLYWKYWKMRRLGFFTRTSLVRTSIYKNQIKNFFFATTPP